MLRLLVGTFKKFMMIPKNTSTNLVGEMMGINFEELVQLNCINSEEKWEARKERRPPDLIRRTEIYNYMRGIPNEWCLILRQQCRICSICKNTTRNQYHMEAAHQIEIYSYKDLWEDIKRTHEAMEKKYKKKNPLSSVPRTEFLEFWRLKTRSLNLILSTIIILD